MVKKFKKPSEDDVFIGTLDVEVNTDIDIDIDVDIDGADDSDSDSTTPREHISKQLGDETKSLNNVLKKIKEDDDQHSPEFFICLYFKTQKQKEQFLNDTGLGRFGDKYLDGNLIASFFGVSLADTKLVTPVHKVDKKLSEFL